MKGLLLDECVLHIGYRRIRKTSYLCRRQSPDASTFFFGQLSTFPFSQLFLSFKLKLLVSKFQKETRIAVQFIGCVEIGSPHTELKATHVMPVLVADTRLIAEVGRAYKV